MSIKTVDDLVGRVLPTPGTTTPRTPPDPQLLGQICDEANALADQMGFPNLAPEDLRRVTLLGAQTSPERLAKHEEFLSDNPVLVDRTLSPGVFGALGTLRNAAVAVKTAARPVAQQCLQACHDAGASLTGMIDVAKRALAAGADLGPGVPFVMVESVLGELQEELRRQAAQSERAQKKGKKLKDDQKAQIGAARERLAQAESVQRFTEAAKQGGKEQ